MDEDSATTHRFDEELVVTIVGICMLAVVLTALVVMLLGGA